VRTGQPWVFSIPFMMHSCRASGNHNTAGRGWASGANNLSLEEIRSEFSAISRKFQEFLSWFCI
jgi:hypothetical protein